MLIIDRYIIRRFVSNFVILFALLFLFAAGIDLILNLDEFVKVAHRSTEAGASALRRFLILLGLMFDFQGPRLFLFYGFMHGMVATGAMGFTLAQMHRHRELTALLASGMSLSRVAMPFGAAMFAVSLLQLLNQEFVLHRVAPLVLRGHGEIGQQGVDEFQVKFVDDGQGRLFQAPSFNPASGTLSYPTILERDEFGRTTRRITADEAVWSEPDGGWELVNGRAVHLPGPDETAGDPAAWREPVAFYASQLNPRTLTVRRYSEYAGMLSLRQIDEMLRSPRLTNTRVLLRHRYARFAAVCVNLLVLAITLPSFLLREPVSLMRQSLICSAMALPAMMGAAVGMTIDLPGITPAVSVFLPVIILIPVAIARWTFLKT